MNNPLKEHEMGDYHDFYEGEVDEKIEIDEKIDDKTVIDEKFFNEKSEK